MQPDHPTPPAPDAQALPDDAAAPTLAKLRKIPKDQRRRKFRPDPAQSWPRRLLARAGNDPQFLRRSVQIAFVLLCLWIGIEFYLFVRWGTSGGAAPFHPRPPGAEAFLPLSALLGLFDWAQRGELNRVHPAATVILLAVIAVSLLMKKSFCSWICPIGTLSEWLAKLGQHLFRRNFVPWKWLDYPLRSLKYLLLFYFVYTMAMMGAQALYFFVHGPYNRIADVKMYLFFAQITPTALGVFAALAVASVFIERFWCRYLCPYGALLGIAGWLSPLRVTRVKSSCIDCKLCTRVCPSRIQVHRIGSRSQGAPVGQVWSDECTTCMQCIDECPVKDTLVLRGRRWPRAVPAPVIAALVVGLFVAITAAGMLTGHWQNTISRGEYLYQFRQLLGPAAPAMPPR